MNYLYKLISMIILIFIISPIIQLTNFLSWSQVKSIIDTNKIIKIDVFESDNFATIDYNESFIVQNQNKLLNIKSYNDTNIKCTEDVQYKTVNFYTKFSKQINFENNVNNYTSTIKLKPINIFYKETFSNVLFSILKNLLITLLVSSILNFSVGNLTRGMTNNPGTLIKPEDLDVEIEMVIGLTETKKEIKQYIDYMKNRDKYEDMNVEIPRGLLFIGPPGCGKTFLAKCIAAEANVNFISVSGSDFHEMFVGVGAARIKSLFKVARANSPCIIFIDEIDSLGQKRAKNAYNSEGNSVLNKLLVEMDGFGDNENILIIAATNRHDTLDNALLRSGRFDRKLIFDKPNIEERQLLFKLYLKDKKIENELKQNKKIKILARQTAGLTGADIKNISNQAGIICIREKQDKIGYDHLNMAIDEIMIGNIKKERLMSKDEKERVAWHEAGHCLLGSLLKDSESPIKVSIIPRGQAALGYSMHQPNDKKLLLKEDLYSKIMVLFGGRIAEDLKFKTISTGAFDDFEKATEIAKLIVTKYCFNNVISIELNQTMQNYSHLSEQYKNTI